MFFCFYIKYFIFSCRKSFKLCIMKFTIEEIKKSNKKSFSVTLFDSVTGFTNTHVFDDSKALLVYINFWL